VFDKDPKTLVVKVIELIKNQKVKDQASVNNKRG